MKTSKNNSKPVIVMFWSIPSYVMLNAYKENCSKLRQAVDQIKSVEVLTKDNRAIQYKSIGLQSGKFFGMEYIKGKIKRILLNMNDIKMVRLL